MHKRFHTSDKVDGLVAWVQERMTKFPELHDAGADLLLRLDNDKTNYEPDPCESPKAVARKAILDDVNSPVEVTTAFLNLSLVSG